MADDGNGKVGLEEALEFWKNTLKVESILDFIKENPADREKQDKEFLEVLKKADEMKSFAECSKDMTVTQNSEALRLIAAKLDNLEKHVLLAAADEIDLLKEQSEKSSQFQRYVQASLRGDRLAVELKEARRVAREAIDCIGGTPEGADADEKHFKAIIKEWPTPDEVK